jgi:tRNA (cytidine/uridine-2'-O-)-methyltransferase
LNLVLLEPEIPGNTGAIGRLCVGLQATLTLVEPLGFSLADKHLKRAGLDYWPNLVWRVLPSCEALLAELTDDSRVFPFTTRCGEPYCSRRFESGDILLFGRETRGLPGELLERFAATCCTIPILGPIRSLNLAMAAGIAAYEAMRQIRGGFSS